MTIDLPNLSADSLLDALIDIAGSFDALLGLIYARRNRAIYQQCQDERQKVVAARHGMSESRVKAIVAEFRAAHNQGGSDAE